MRFNLRDSITVFILAAGKPKLQSGEGKHLPTSFLKRSFPLRGLFALTCNTEFIVSSDSSPIQNQAACLQLNREERVAAMEQ